jgi:hypothetical protein
MSGQAPDPSPVPADHPPSPSAGRPESTRSEPGTRNPEPGTPSFAWPAFFQRSADALFLLDRQRRLRFVNRAWEALTGVAAADARLLPCRRPRPASGDEPPAEALKHALCPPPEVLAGAAGRARRRLPAPGRGGWAWWDVEFFPLRGDGGLVGTLGRILPVPGRDEPGAPPLPEAIAALRERAAGRFGTDLLAGRAPAVRRLAEQVRLAARVDVPVLLVGGPGAGKETLARVIHYQSAARERPFAAVDCARLPVPTLAALLAGEGRPFPGRPGAVYLREPSRLPRDVQARLAERPADAGGPRLLAGCTADPAAEVRAGRLVEELHAALSTLVIEVPPLRERRADLPELVDRLLGRAGEAGGGRVTGLTAEAWEVVRGHGWPGNFRELYAVLAGAARRARGPLVDAADLPAYLRLARQLEGTPGPEAERPLPLDPLLEEAERRLIRLALRRARGNRTRAAELLGVWRPRLLRRIEALGIDVPGQAAEGPGEERGKAGES